MIRNDEILFNLYFHTMDFNSYDYSKDKVNHCGWLIYISADINHWHIHGVVRINRYHAVKMFKTNSNEILLHVHGYWRMIDRNYIFSTWRYGTQTLQTLLNIGAGCHSQGNCDAEMWCFRGCHPEQAVAPGWWITTKFIFTCVNVPIVNLNTREMTAIWFRPRQGLCNGRGFDMQWNLSVTTTSTIRFITCDLFSSVFEWILKVSIYSC